MSVNQQFNGLRPDRVRFKELLPQRGKLELIGGVNAMQGSCLQDHHSVEAGKELSVDMRNLLDYARGKRGLNATRATHYNRDGGHDGTREWPNRVSGAAL